MKMLNPTGFVIKNKSRVDGKWFDGIWPGQVIDVFNSFDIRALFKAGCVEYKEKKTKPVKKPETKPKKSKRGGKK